MQLPVLKADYSLWITSLSLDPVHEHTQAVMTSSLPSSELNSGESVAQIEDGPVAAIRTANLSLSSNGLLPTATGGHATTMLDPVAGESSGRGDGVVRKKLSKLLKGKEEEWAAVVQKKGPLKLLDLPMDILKEIVKEVTHTNDLTALALTHSALHNLAIPHIYSRFDIVWPDATSTSDTRTGVDALTYGLATLVMGHNVFGQCSGPGAHVGQAPTCKNCGAQIPCTGIQSRKRRLGNNYPQFTRKFSLGNGPADWVQEYMITKESGKMLGTLVALAVARMVNLETFIWDMPTGVLRDVWLALSSLQDKSPLGECRLERLLVRWHDNSVDSSQSLSNSGPTPLPSMHNPAGSTITSVGIMIPGGATAPFQANQGSVSANANNSANRVESPTFSVVPPLKSLSVLDIDELAYLDEMSVLIQKSKDRLQELRVGISKKAVRRDFVQAWDGSGLQQVDHNANWPGAPSSIGERRLGGILGILLGRVYDIRKKPKSSARFDRSNTSPFIEPFSQSTETQGVDEQDASHVLDLADFVAPLSAEHAGNIEGSISSAMVGGGSNTIPLTLWPSAHTNLVSYDPSTYTGILPDFSTNLSATITSPGAEFTQPQVSPSMHSVSLHPSPVIKETPSTPFTDTYKNEKDHLDGKLRLKVLELERVPLSIAVLQKAFDWSMITSLTILDCAYHETLWRMLRRQFQPQISPKSALATSSFVRHSISVNSASKPIPNVPMEYQLNLKKIHTDFATPALIAFLKETLAPNTLEVLFLQDRRKNTPPPVSINDIYRGPLKRHRRSLKKLLIDSSDKIPKGPSSSNESVRWRTWMLNHEVLAYITSGSMTSLRELSIVIDYKDWHFFLRRLPQIPTLRSLNIPYIADHVTPAYDPRELALQVVDVIFLRPEIELCYLGISNKCFEILENRNHDDSSSSSDVTTNGGTGDHVTDEEDDDDDEGEGSEDEAEEDDDDEDEEDGTATEAVEAEGVEYDTSDPGDSDVESSDGSDDDRARFSLKLREILFYDDKVAIFKARHMRL